MANSDISITVLISGNGTNLQALIDNSTSSTNQDITPEQRKLPSNARITHVISNRKNAFGLERAQKASISTTYHNLVSYKKRHPSTEEGIQQAREEYDRDLARIIIGTSAGSATSTTDTGTTINTTTDMKSGIEAGSKPRAKPSLVICAGWMHILNSSFIDLLRQENIRIINLHPALPGQFNGADAITRAWQAFQRGEITSTGVMVHHVIGEVDMGAPILVQDVKCIPEEPETGLETRIHEIEWKLLVDATAKVLQEIEEERQQRGKASGEKSS